jgi:3,4-dihydroxy-2-butanone 4-phosphate synthase
VNQLLQLPALLLQRPGGVGSQYGITVDTVGITDGVLAQDVMETFNEISYNINSQPVSTALPNTVAAVAAASTNGAALTVAGKAAAVAAVAAAAAATAAADS